MARVPYSPVPEVASQAPAIPAPSINTPPAAFGGAEAEAIGQFGSTLEKVGDEIFARASAIQQLNNQTESVEAATKYMIGAGDLHANYNALQGRDRVLAFPKYSKDLQELRVKIRSGLSNPMAQKMYDSESMTTMGRSIFNGAGAAASANKEWTINTAKAQLDLDLKSVEDDPSNSNFAEKLRKIETSARSIAAQQGMGEGSPMEQDLILKSTSKAWAQRITGLSRTKPFEAAQLLDKSSKFMTEDDRLKVDNTVRSASRAVGSVNIANEVYGAGMETPTRPGKTLSEMEKEAEARAKALNPDDPILAQHAVAALRGKFNQDKYAKRQEEIGNEQTVYEAIRGGVRNEQELRADPKVAAAIDALPPSKRLAIPGAINRYNAASAKDENEAEFYRLKGMSNNNVEEFLNTDVTKSKLSRPQMDQLQILQQKLKDKQNSDPRVAKAVTILRGSMGAQLEALGIFRRTDANKDDYDNFTGALQAGIDTWIETHGKPPSAKDITDVIGPQVIQQRTEPGFFNIGGYGTTKQVPFFNQTVPESFTSKLSAEVMARGGAKPTPEQIYRAYVRSQYIKLYGKKEKSE